MSSDKDIRRFNMRLAALTLGAVTGILAFLVTVISTLVDVQEGTRYLFLWSVFLPGYEVSFTGAVVGALWGLFWGGLAGVLIYRIYDAEWHLEEAAPESSRDSGVSPPFVFLDGNALGLGLGLVSGAALFAATAWLVLRGTADGSIHAQLLTWYLPGYSVSMTGGLMGALWTVLFVYLFSRVGASVYNVVLNLRGRSNA